MTTLPRTPAHLLTLAELERETWASCGPASLAALLGPPLGEIRHAFPSQQAGRTWTNLTMMRAALQTLGCAFHETAADGEAERARQHYQALPTRRWPTRGLVLVQFRGSWDPMPINHPAQLQRSHWIAVKPHPRLADVPLVFDVNAIDDRHPTSLGWWEPRQRWEAIIVPQLVEHFGKRATGDWWVRAGLEVTPW